MLLINYTTIKMKFHFKTENYLLQKRYDYITNLFLKGKITKEDYKIFIDYYENEATTNLFTVNLNWIINKYEKQINQ